MFVSRELYYVEFGSGTDRVVKTLQTGDHAIRANRSTVPLSSTTCCITLGPDYMVAKQASSHEEIALSLDVESKAGYKIYARIRTPLINPSPVPPNSVSLSLYPSVPLSVKPEVAGLAVCTKHNLPGLTSNWTRAPAFASP